MDVIVGEGAQENIELDSGDLVVDAVTERGSPVVFSVRDRRLTVEWPRRASPNQKRQIEIAYHGSPQSGVLFAPDRSQVYTIFTASQWMVCVNAPDERATMELAIVLPAGLAVVASGRQIAQRTLAGGAVLHEWRQDRPMPSYTYGFAAGRFTDVRDDRGGRHRLRYLGDGFSAGELRRIFADSADMMTFFEDRAGSGYREDVYAQALVVNTAGQEMSGFSVLSEEYGRTVLADQRSESLIAHELAHQWWGNRVTCAAWTEMWLNEGFATFMAAAYMEHRFGRDEYLRAVDGWRARYEKIRDAGRDRSLVFTDWNRPSADDRALVYQKGAYALHLLREALGERQFWSGVREYTRTNDGRHVTSRDFQRAMEKAGAKDLSGLFRTWVYLD